MAYHDDISEFQSFSERTLKYGRNLMVASNPLNVFAWSGAVDLANCKPFSFQFNALIPRPALIAANVRANPPTVRGHVLSPP